MPFRVSTTQIIDQSLYGINSAFNRFDVAQQRVNTGRQLNTPSDDPSGTAQTLDFRQSLGQIDQFNRTLDQAKGFLSTSETSLSSVTDLLRQARSLAVQGASDNTSAETRQALAGQIQNIITQIGNIGNTSYGTRYVFGGQRTTDKPFQGAGDGFKYVGGSASTGDGDITLDVGRGEALKANVAGDAILSPLVQQTSPGPPPVTSVLGKLRDDIAFGASGEVSRDDLAALDTQINNVLAARADIGAKVQRIDLTKQRNELSKVNFTKFVSDIEDTDIPKAVVELQTAQTAYQAALQATSRSFQNSLLDFLR